MLDVPMFSALAPMYRLTARGGVGLACDERGSALGPVPLVEALAAGTRRVFHPRPAEEIARTLALAYGPLSPQDITHCLFMLDIAARALEAGDVAKASVAAVLLKLPDLTAEAFAKLAGDASLKKCSPDRDGTADAFVPEREGAALPNPSYAAGADTKLLTRAPAPVAAPTDEGRPGACLLPG